ncbi:MAG TPA: SpoIIE family protein phosphatase [Spirochaetota bacterium]|nr:SpoIIE family protein phosphatase [Spirochaetota bacterium]
MHTRIRSVLALVLIWTCTTVVTADSAQVRPLRILVVQSYNASMLWSQAVQRGIEETIEKEAPESHIESFYMDTKFHFSPEYMSRLADLFRFKYTGQLLDAVITVDDAALAFLLELRPSVMPATPLAYCGVNRLSNDRPAGHEGVLGIVEDIDIASTIDLARSLHPGLRTVYVINDRTMTGLENRRMLNALTPRWPSLRFVYFDTLSWNGLSQAVAAIPDASIILLLTHTTDAAGVSMSYRESIRKIRAVARVPIYGVWDFYLGRGLLGGMITSGFDQGRRAALLALSMVQGNPADQLVSIRKSPNQPVFDAAEMARFRISRDRLPEGSTVINLPPSFVRENFPVVVAALSFILIVTIVIALLLVSIRRRKNAESSLRESESRYRTLSRELEETVALRTNELKHRNLEMQQLLDELGRDAQAGQRIQFQLLPETPYHAGEYRIDHLLHPSRYLSGDFLDYFEIDADHTGLYMADVSGHGLPSAFVTVFLKSLIDQALEKYRSGSSRIITNPARLLLHLNGEILRQHIDKHLTIFYGVLERSTNRLTWANGGQFPFPVLSTPSGTSFIEQNSHPVGLFGFADYTNVIFELPEVFSLTLASDGILEIINENNLGEKERKLLQAADRTKGEISPVSILRRLDFDEGRALPDDITILVLTRE